MYKEENEMSENQLINDTILEMRKEGFVPVMHKEKHVCKWV